MVSKATIFRLDNIRTRSMKTTYKHLTSIQKRYIKLHESYHQWSKEITDFWWHVERDENGRASQNNDWEFYWAAEAALTKIENQIARFLQKHNWSKQQALEVVKYHNEMNIGRCYGGSF